VKTISIALVALLVTACAGVNYESFGDEVETELDAALAVRQSGESALMSEEASYWIPQDQLVAERGQLLKVLRETPYLNREEASMSSDASTEASIEPPSGIVTWVHSEVFEAECPTGTLHIERSMFHDRNRAWYGVYLFQKRRVLYAGIKQGAALDDAWLRLTNGARLRARVRIEGRPGDRPRPLQDLSDVGVDFRGVAEASQ